MSASRSDGPGETTTHCRPLPLNLWPWAWSRSLPLEMLLRRARRSSASDTVPVVFTIGGDPVRFGLIKSINRPGGNVTGILFNQNVLGAKRIELLREIVRKRFSRRAADEPHQPECQN